MPLTYQYAALHSYQKALMHKNELKTHPTLINSVIKEYELKVGTIETHKSTGSLIIKF